jgi:AcrR family transcriptional regulator
MLRRMEAAERPLRADAERNRRRILDAARDVLAARGMDAGIDEIARVAGVGVGTVYRRFPTKDDLVTAVIHDRVDTLVARMVEAGEAGDPWEAFTGVVRAFAELISCDRALYETVMNEPSLRDPVRRRVRAAVGPVLERAQAAGVVRADFVTADVGALASVAARLPPWRLERQPRLWERYLTIVLDGVRPEGATPLRHGPPGA